MRVAVAVLAVAFTLADRTFYEGETDLLHAAVAGGVYLPVLALALSVRASALTWVLLAAASLAVLPGSLSQLVGVAFVGVVLNGVLTFALTAREWGVFWALFSLYVWAHGAASTGRSSAVVVLVTAMVLAGVLGLLLSRYRERWVRASERVEVLQRVQGEVRAEERTAIAHELHDIVAHDITAIVMQARRARFVDDDKRLEILEMIGEAGQSTLEDLRRMLMLLRRTDDPEASTHARDRDAVLDVMSGGEDAATVSAEGLVTTLEKVAAALRGAGMEVSLRLSGDPAAIPTVIRQSLRRIVRELGTNILKHGDPSAPVDLSLQVGDGDVTLRARNRVGTAHPVMSSGTGVEALKTRIEVFEGTISMGVTADHDWVTRIRIPFVR